MRKLYFFSLFLLITSLPVFSQNYTILGNASQLAQCNTYQLTPNQGDQAGAIFQNKTINMNNSFDFTFSNFFGCNGASGADGEAFVITTNPNGLGNQGEGLGYGGANQPCSFAIEFDTWQNTDHNDPPYDHTAFESGGSVDHNVAGPVAAIPSQSNLDNCQWHTIRIVWDVNTNTMSDYIDGVLRISAVLPNFINTFLCGNPIVNWGWTGSTGGGWNLQQVRIITISNWVAGTNYESCSTTVPFTDISTSNVGTVQSWNWSFGDGGTSTLQNPTHTYPDTGLYTASLIITNLDGCADTFSHTVHIVAPITLTPTVTDPLCNGAQTGSIAIAVAGGFGVSAGHGGFTYNWSNASQQQTDIGLGAGTYTVSVTDGVCSASGQYTVNQPTALSASTSATAANCGVPNGTCTIVISGGTPGYTNVTFAGIAATGGPNSFTATGFLGGTYIANFNDANGCSALLQYNATVPTLPCNLSSSTSTTNVTCFGGTDGSATLTVTGSAVSPPATITWTFNGNAAGTGVTINNLVAGTYNYTYTDQNAANTFTGSVTITQPGAAFVASLATTNVSCGGQTNGQAIASVTSGGTAPFSYQWSAAGQTNNPVANNLGASTITVTVTDASNICTATATGTISSPTPLQLSITSTNNACNKFNNGSATANVTGGTAPYQYSWSNIASGQTDLNLSGGVFTVTVTDSALCTITRSVTISESTPFVNTVDSTNILCYGDSTGTITVTTSGGATPYAYTWSADSSGIPDAALTGAAITGLKAGTYLLTVTDANGCIFGDSTFLQQPAAPLIVDTSHGNVTCFGADNGYITITISGGTLSYTYQAQPIPPGPDTVNNLAAGVYAGVVMDANGCAVAVSMTVTSPPADSLVMTEVNNLCNGAMTGSATANFVNPNGAVTYGWSNNQSGAAISNLISGTYYVTGTDANGCVLTDSAVISQPPAITMQTVQTNIDCFGNTDGIITVTPAGGTGAPYTYTWTPNVSTTNTANNLATGLYVITVTDQNACTHDTIITITQPAMPLSATYVVTNVPCFNTSTGSIVITPAGGTPAYSYTWNPNTVAGSSATSLAAGAYAVTITDNNGCTVDSSFTLTQPATALTATSSQTNLTCFDSNNGTASVVAAGGTTPYHYAWTGTNAATAMVTNLAAGNYGVVVTDTNGCTVSQSYLLTQPQQITTTPATVNILCNGASTGSITLNNTAGGAGAPYIYTWAPNVSASNAAGNIPAGTYDVTITDPDGCTALQTVTLSQPTPDVVSPVTTEVSCNGYTDGTLTVTANGGTPAYSYQITDGVTPHVNGTGVFTGLAANPYSVYVTDANGCVDSAQAVVAYPLPLTDQINAAGATCYYLTNGQIDLQASGGTPAYTFAVAGLGSNSSGVYTNVKAGTYNLTITDANGCTLPDSAVVPATDSIVVTVVPANGQVTLGDTLSLTSINNQVGNVSLLWTPTTGLSCYDCPDPVFNGNYSEQYTVAVTNDSGCTANFSFTVTVNPDYNLYIPNAFTPTGDGKNDYWQVYGDVSTIKQIQVMVFDRWGEKVFESTDVNFRWDGYYKGHITQGVYVYAIKIVWLNNRADDMIKGSITLLH